MSNARIDLGRDHALIPRTTSPFGFLAWLGRKVSSLLAWVLCSTCSLQRKYLKHQTFENEIHGRAEQVEGLLILGNSLIERRACDGQEENVKVGSVGSGTEGAGRVLHGVGGGHGG